MKTPEATRKRQFVKYLELDRSVVLQAYIWRIRQARSA